MARDRPLPWMRAGVVDTLVESDGGAFESLERHRTGDIGDPGQPFCPEEGEPANRMHGLGPVEQGEAFFGP